MQQERRVSRRFSWPHPIARSLSDRLSQGVTQPSLGFEDHTGGSHCGRPLSLLLPEFPLPRLNETTSPGRPSTGSSSPSRRVARTIENTGALVADFRRRTGGRLMGLMTSDDSAGHVSHLRCDLPGYRNRCLVGMAFYLIAARVIGGLLAACFGLIDSLAIPTGMRAKTIGLWHGASNVLVVLLFSVNWLLRWRTLNAPLTPALTLSFSGVGPALVAGWLGGDSWDAWGSGWMTGRTRTPRARSPADRRSRAR